jgi:hypothetical protein
MKDKERIAPVGLSQPTSPSHRKPMRLRNLCSRAEAYDSLHFKVAEVSTLKYTIYRLRSGTTLTRRSELTYLIITVQTIMSKESVSVDLSVWICILEVPGSNPALDVEFTELSNHVLPTSRSRVVCRSFANYATSPLFHIDFISLFFTY